MVYYCAYFATPGDDIDTAQERKLEYIFFFQAEDGIRDYKVTGVQTCALPIYAALHGVTCGGGLEMALMCDFMVATESAKIGDAHANFGAMPGGGATVRLPRVVGPNMAKFLMFTGELLLAPQ